jgi:hypothetical protein
LQLQLPPVQFDRLGAKLDADGVVHVGGEVPVDEPGVDR